MAYRTYITEALVCGSRPNHTSDRTYLLFTREAGMLYATAKSVREERSKQRYALQEFSYIRATLVHGKGGWRVAGVEPRCDLYANADTRERRALLRNIIVLLRRVMQGETPHVGMFDTVIMTIMGNITAPTEDQELVLMLHILEDLGYIPARSEYVRLLKSDIVSILREPLTESERSHARTAVHSALEESHL